MARGHVHLHICDHHAFDLARRTDRPVLILLNRRGWPDQAQPSSDALEKLGDAFVLVHADGDEQPGLSALATGAIRATTGRSASSGLLFLTPEGYPFAASDPLSAERAAAWADQLGGAWRSQRSTIAAESARLYAALRPAPDEPASSSLAETVGEAFGALSARLDHQHGDFTPNTHGPSLGAIDALLHWYRRTGSHRALRAADRGLRLIATGPLADPVAGGFFTSLDPATPGRPVPHKALATNAYAARTFLFAWRTTGEAAYRDIAKAALAWITTALENPEGGFAAARELGAVTASRTHRGLDASETALDESERRAGCPPVVDGRRFLGANALLLAALADGAEALGLDELRSTAEHLGQHLLHWPRDDNGYLLHRYPSATAPGPPTAASLADHAALLHGFLGFANNAPGHSPWFEATVLAAGELQRALAAELPSLTLGHGLDGDSPSAIGLTATALRRYAIYTGEQPLIDTASALLSRYESAATADPLAFASTLGALEQTLPRQAIDLTAPTEGPVELELVTVLIGGSGPVAVAAAAALARHGRARGLNLEVRTASPGATDATEADVVLMLEPAATALDPVLGGYAIREFVRLGLDATERTADQSIGDWCQSWRKANLNREIAGDQTITGDDEVELLAEGVAFVLSRVSRPAPRPLAEQR